VYHARALRGMEQWRDYHAHVAEFLSEWNPTESEIILVGPSAGYSLPTEFLQRFDAVIGMEVDPIARWAFERRHDKKVEWLPGGFDPATGHLRRALAKHPDSAVLFCNFLGQLPFLFPDADIPKLHRRLRIALEGRTWASYHDRLSGRFDAEDARRDYALSPTPSSLARDWNLDGEIVDHETEDMSYALPVSIFPWQITAGQTHLIEAVYVNSQSR